MIGAVVLLCYWLAIHLTSPVRNLQKAVERFGQGDLSTLPTQVFDPLSGNPATGLRQPFSSNVIPASRIDPISRNLLAYWPEPNLSGNAANFIATPSEKIDYNQVTTRIDHNLTANDRLMGRYNYIDQPFFRGNYAPLAGSVAPLRNNGVVLQYTRIVSPRAVNESLLSIKLGARRKLLASRGPLAGTRLGSGRSFTIFCTTGSRQLAGI